MLTLKSLVAAIICQPFAVRQGLSESLVLRLWDSCCSFIRQHILEGKAIYVPRLGTFRVGKVKVNGSSRSLSFPQPTFEFADIFSSIPTTVPKFIPAESHHGRTLAERKVHECRLNFTTIGKAAGCSRDLCQRLIRDIINHLGQQLAIRQTISISFGLGKLASQDGKIAFKFEEEFLHLCKMERKMLHKDRPNTQIENTYDGAYSGSTDDNARQPASNSFEAVIQACEISDRLGSGMVRVEVLEDALLENLDSILEAISAKRLLLLIRKMASTRHNGHIRYGGFIEELQNIDVKEKLRNSAYPPCSGSDDKARHQLQDERNTNVCPTQTEMIKVNDCSAETEVPLQEQEHHSTKSVSKGEAGALDSPLDPPRTPPALPQTKTLRKQFDAYNQELRSYRRNIRKSFDGVTPKIVWTLESNAPRDPIVPVAEFGIQKEILEGKPSWMDGNAVDINEGEFTRRYPIMGRDCHVQSYRDDLENHWPFNQN